MADADAAGARYGGGVPDVDPPSLGAPAGWCEQCVHAKVNRTNRGTAYLRCLRAAWDDRMTRYPRLPVVECVGFERPE
ncbi:MAG: hypothetical protein WA892_14035, partial [Ornithinimicrobium sp.]